MIYLKLDTPFDPGSYDAGNTYPHALVTSFNMAVLDAIIEIRYSYGTFDATKGWVSGPGSIPQVLHVQGAEFVEAISAMPQDGDNDSVLMAAARECYRYLAKDSAAQGTVVDSTTDVAAGSSAAGSATSTEPASTASTSSGAASAPVTSATTGATGASS